MLKRAFAVAWLIILTAMLFAGGSQLQGGASTDSGKLNLRLLSQKLKFWESLNLQIFPGWCGIGACYL
jgi:hypothetical protein